MKDLNFFFPAVVLYITCPDHIWNIVFSLDAILFRVVGKQKRVTKAVTVVENVLYVKGLEEIEVVRLKEKT